MRHERLIIEGRDYVPARWIVGWFMRFTFMSMLALGIGVTMALPWLYKTQELLSIQNRVELQNCQTKTVEIKQALLEIGRQYNERMRTMPKAGSAMGVGGEESR